MGRDFSKDEQLSIEVATMNDHDLKGHFEEQQLFNYFLLRRQNLLSHYLQLLCKGPLPELVSRPLFQTFRPQQ